MWIMNNTVPRFKAKFMECYRTISVKRKVYRTQNYSKVKNKTSGKHFKVIYIYNSISYSRGQAKTFAQLNWLRIYDP